MKYVYVLINDFGTGKTISAHETLEGAERQFSEVLMLYNKEEGYDLNTSVLNDSELYELTDGGVTLAIERTVLKG
jgi:hypothetical protein